MSKADRNATFRWFAYSYWWNWPTTSTIRQRWFECTIKKAYNIQTNLRILHPVKKGSTRRRSLVIQNWGQFQKSCSKNLLIWLSKLLNNCIITNRHQIETHFEGPKSISYRTCNRQCIYDYPSSLEKSGFQSAISHDPYHMAHIMIYHRMPEYFSWLTIWKAF